MTVEKLYTARGAAQTCELTDNVNCDPSEEQNLHCMPPDEQVIRLERRQTVQSAVMSLEPQMRECVIRKFGIDCKSQSCSEIQKETGIPANEVRKCISHAIRCLRKDKRLAGLHADFSPSDSRKPANIHLSDRKGAQKDVQALMNIMERRVPPDPLDSHRESEAVSGIDRFEDIALPPPADICTAGKPFSLYKTPETANA